MASNQPPVLVCFRRYFHLIARHHRHVHIFRRVHVSPRIYSQVAIAMEDDDLARGFPFPSISWRRRRSGLRARTAEGPQRHHPRCLACLAQKWPERRRSHAGDQKRVSTWIWISASASFWPSAIPETREIPSMNCP